MQFQFFTNACLEIITSDARILCDPWLVPGAFDGSWYHDHSLRIRPEDLTAYTHLYVSHIHPDHLDARSLRRMPNKSVPVIILKTRQKFVYNAIQRAGFSNIIEVADGESVNLTSETQLTMYKAFTASSLVADAEVPNIIDSSIVVQNRGLTLFNANDNTPTPEVCGDLRERFGTIDCALMPYSGVGPYPSCYLNLSDSEKDAAAESKIQAFLQRTVENCLALEPETVVLIAGEMLLGGRQFHKNRQLGLPPRTRAVKVLEGAGVNALALEEGDEYDVGSGRVTAAHWSPLEPQESYEIRIAQERYWWEDAFQVPGQEQCELLPLISRARERMWHYQHSFGFSHDSWVIIEVPDMWAREAFYAFPMNSDGKVLSLDEKAFVNLTSSKAYLQAVVPYNYLTALLTRHCHWNNAYHGCHVDWYRSPDVYRPEIQTLMSFLHL